MIVQHAPGQYMTDGHISIYGSRHRPTIAIVAAAYTYNQIQSYFDTPKYDYYHLVVSVCM